MKDKRIDNYISKAQPFAQPILTKLRQLIHKACPEVIETIKWGMPAFEFNGPLCDMASFKAHCVFGFRKASLMKDPVLIENAKSETAMGHLGKLTSLKDLPSDKKMEAWIKEAMQLTDKGIKLPARAKTTEKKELVVPDYFVKALAKNKKAKQVFDCQ